MRSKGARRGRLAAVAGAIVGLLAGSAYGEVVAREDLFGHEVRVERARDGAVSLVVPGAPGVTLSASGTPRVERVTVGAGAVLVVRVEGEAPAAALVAGTRGAAPVVLFQGRLRLTGEDVGERVATEILVRDLDGDGAADVVLLERREDVRVCGAGLAPVHARAVAPQSLRLVPVVLNPLRGDLYADALPPARAVNAVAVTGTERALLPALTFGPGISGGAPADAPAVLTDRRDETTWRLRDRDVLTATAMTAGVPVERVVLTAPPAPYALPRTFTLLLEPAHQRVDVTVPAGLVVPPGGRIAVPIVPARAVSCLSLVPTDRSAAAALALAEVELATPLDRDPNAIEALVRALEGGQGEQAATLLAALGARGVDAVAAALPRLGEQGAHRAIRLLATARTPAAATALVAALGRRDVADEARTALQRFGAAGLDALASVVATDARAADLILVARAPLDARLRAMVGVLTAAPAVWRQARGAVLALVGEAARAGAMGTWLALVPAETGPAARALSVATEAATDDAQRAEVAAHARALEPRTFADRFRLLVPLAGDAEGRAAVARVALEDPDADLRAEAVRALRIAGGARETLVRALEDPVPRVRAEAAAGLAGQPEGRAALEVRLARDGWPGVRAAAATALAGDGANAPALLAALDDPSVFAVRAVIAALERTPAPAIGPRLMAFAEDLRRNPELRSDALAALANRCERGVSDRLIALFDRQSDPVLPPAEQAVGHAALAALARIDPARARAELRRLEANPLGVAALERAMRNACPAR